MRTRALTALAAGIIIPLAGLAMATAPARAATASLLPCALKTGDKLTYHQHGLVADDPAVVLILWGHYWTTDRAKPQISELEQLFRGLGKSSYARTLSQYCGRDSTGHGSPPDTDYASLLDRAVTDDTVAPRHPTDAQFTAEVAKVVPWNDYAGPVNVIITPPGVIPAAEAGGGCGHHGSGNVPDPPDIRWYSWADVPWGLISANPSGKCQPYGNAAYGLSVVAAHEWAETVTDPFGASSDGGGYIGPAWADTSTNPGNEIADLCDNANPNLVTLSTGKFELPELWSNEAGPGKGECVMGS